jgi:hypothetical protein
MTERVSARQIVHRMLRTDVVAQVFVPDEGVVPAIAGIDRDFGNAQAGAMRGNEFHGFPEEFFGIGNLARGRGVAARLA